MAWYPGARKMELQPESDDQPAIRPTQFIMHSIAAPWDEERLYAYWRDSTNLESHFGLDYDGSLGQYIGTQTKADASYRANLRGDGTGAVSIETASNDDASDPWSPEQCEQLIRLGVWLHRTHGIPLRVCRTWDDPGFGYHRLHSQWAVSGTDCPGDARVQQFKKVIFPGIVARATGQSEEDPMPSPADLWSYRIPIPDGREVSAGDILAWTDNRHNVVHERLVAVEARLDRLVAAVEALAKSAPTKEA
ncbi:N-acetylmuramoyl-L-alanine amidase [Streptomyces sp. NPDC101206]|uniref:peptidoglycan recognition protein family protein n=1 Tax=Streptomyces sp. NPDC101206 TaxID=3366128 RepID=UPI0037FEDD67